MSAQDSLIPSTIELHEMNGFRFELHHQSTACPECEGCFCKDVFVYSSLGTIIHQQKIKGNALYPNRMIDQMDVYDFNFDGYPDFRLVDFDVYYDTYYIYQPESNTYRIDPYLSQCTSLLFNGDQKEVFGMCSGTISLEGKNLKMGAELNAHRLHFKGKSLEQLTIESKVWYNPWNGPAFYEDTIGPKYLHTRTCTYKNAMIEQIGEEKITIGHFSEIPLCKDSINLRLKDDYYLKYIQPQMNYKTENPSNYSLYKDRATDTTMNNKKYNWVVYDMNKNPFEIGEDYTNGIKNGEWIKRDQQARVISIENYRNDTLNGLAEYYYYHNYPWNVTRFSGLNVKGCKIGEWTYYQSGKFNSLEGKWTKDIVQTYDLNGMLVSRSEFSPKVRLENTYFYSSTKEEIWFISYDKHGRITESVPYKAKIKSLDGKE